MTAKTKERGKTTKKNQFPIFGAHVPKTRDVREKIVNRPLRLWREKISCSDVFVTENVLTKDILTRGSRVLPYKF